MRLEGKVAVVVGAGQTAGETIGNGRATAILFAREGARVVLVDRDIDSARQTGELIEAEGGTSVVCQADWTIAEDCKGIVQSALDTYGRIDVLHNNVGIGLGEDGGVHRLAEDTWDKVMDVNLKGMFLTCKEVVPVMREQRAGSIINISSIAAVSRYPPTAYKVSKAGVNALTQSLAMANAQYGIRVNAIMPGLMNTPMAIEVQVRARGRTRQQVVEERDAMVPLLGKQGTAWDIAYAATFLASDEARFITGVILPVDGGQTARVG